MKKNRKLCLAIAAFLSLNAFAQGAPSKNLTEGFYRVQNYMTGRYACVYDNKGWINYQNTSADMGAICLALPAVNNRFSDPATVCYVDKQSHKHNVLGQNTSLLEISGHYVQIQDATTSDKKAAYQITPLFSAKTIFLHDGATYIAYEVEKGLTSHVKGDFNTPTDDTYYWNFVPFTPNGVEYLGIAPNEAMKVDGKYYKPYVIGFDMKFLSEGMKAYYVSDVKSDAVILKEIQGTIPYNTPVIVECSTLNPETNRVDVRITKSAQIPNNRLTGQYFCYSNHDDTAYKEYNSSTMRVLKVKDGKLVFGVADAEDNVSTTQLRFKKVVNNQQSYIYKQCLSANSSYLSVPANFPAEIAVMTEEEYNATHGGAVSGDADGNGSVNVADVNGNGGIVEMVLKKTAENFPTADFNKDGKVTIVDIALLIKQLLTNK